MQILRIVVFLIAKLSVRPGIGLFTGMVLLCLCSIEGHAQEDYSLELSNSEGLEIKYKRSYKDSAAVALGLKALIAEYHRKTYLLAGVDTSYWKGKCLHAKLYVGETFQWASVRSGNISEELLRKIDFKERFFTEKPLRPVHLFELEKELIRYSVNHGYPFATVKLDSVQITGQSVAGVLNYDPGSQVVYESIEILGETGVKEKFLQNYLQIKPNALFDQRKLDNIPKMIQQLNSVQILKPHQIKFKNEKAIVVMYLKDKKNNSIDGIVGFQQNPKDDKLMFTGQFDLGLHNISGRGKSFEMHWKKTDVNSQLMNLAYQHLNLFGTGFHSEVKFYLFKQDTSFLQRKPYLEFFRNHPRLGKIKFFYELDDSRIIGKQAFTEGTIPTISNIKTNYYGLGAEWNNLDDASFPRKGLKLDLRGSAGNKRILDPELVPGLDQKSVQLKGGAQLEYHIKMNNFLGIYSRVVGGIIENETLFLNELYRLGGIKSIRGFREYSIYASRYAVGTLEGRFFLDSESYFLVFSDYAVYENDIAGDKPPHQGPPLGLGAGISFSTKTGVFSFIYGVGREGSNAINFSNSVVNFGMTSRF